MKTITKFISGIIGVIFILIPLLRIIGIISVNKNFDTETLILQNIGQISIGFLFIWVSIKKDNYETRVEKYYKIKNIPIQIWWKRIIAIIIDNVIIMILYISFMLIYVDVNYERLDQKYNPLFIFLIINIIYYTIVEYFYDTSIGKAILGYKIISIESNSKPTFEQIIKRAFTRILPINFLFFLIKRPIGLHEIISKTVTIKKYEVYN